MWGSRKTSCNGLAQSGHTVNTNVVSQQFALKISIPKTNQSTSN